MIRALHRLDTPVFKVARRRRALANARSAPSPSTNTEGSMTGFTPIRVGLVLLLVAAPAALTQEVAQKVKPQGGMMTASATSSKMKKMSNAELIRSALSAGPREIAEHAAVIAPDANGKMAEIHAGTNG